MFTDHDRLPSDPTIEEIYSLAEQLRLAREATKTRQGTLAEELELDVEQGELVESRARAALQERLKRLMRPKG